MALDESLRKTRNIILGILATQLVILFLIFFPAPWRAAPYLGFAAGQQGGVWAWLLAAVTVVLYTRSAASISTVRTYMFKADSLKLLAVLAAFAAAIVEEVIFRKLVMDFLQERGQSSTAQVLAGAISFGLAHLAWGFKSWRAALNAALSTTILGAALGVVYLLADRSLAPCVVAHFLISALIEPGLIHAAVQDKLGIWREQTTEEV
ncbi:MAG: CPBP family intramembrane glutamic endopeptidase [Gammaproteobacteria bacterium]